MKIVSKMSMLAAVMSLTAGAADFNREATLKWFTENFYGEPNAAAIRKATVKPEIFYPADAKIGHPVPVIIHGDHNRIDINGRVCQPNVPTNAILKAGYAYVHYNFNDVAPNVYSVVTNRVIYKKDIRKPDPVQPTLATWAWGFSRVIDQIERDPLLDAKKIVTIGHSRGGKTSLWAAANDPRVALAVSSGSGTGGARYLHHANDRAESIRSMATKVLAHWFTPKYAVWIDREQELPHDMDELLKCIYPRAVYIMSGENDEWADPIGEQMSRDLAAPLWSGKLASHIGGHVRAGGHGLLADDWLKVLAFADNVFDHHAIVTPESQGVSSKGILRWIEQCEKQMDCLHGFVIRRHGKVIAEGSWKPFDTLNTPHALWSHSKTFTATAIGFLVDDNQLDLDDRVIEIMPDKIPAAPSENLKQLRVRDLLTMNLGANRTDAEGKDPDGDWEKALLHNTIDNQPGTGFRYDSGATYLLSCIVERKSGKRMMEYLKEKLFDHIGITKAVSTTSPSGTACGGWGMFMTTREMNLFGQFMLDRGAWNTRQLLSADWVDLATTKQTLSSKVQNLGLLWGSDWGRGYGFQCWRSKYGYRADGANGQFTLVIPEKDAVISLSASHGKTQVELDLVWDYLIPAMMDEPLPEDDAAYTKLVERCASLAMVPLKSEGVADARLFGVELPLADNRHLKSFRFDVCGKAWSCTVEGSAGKSTFPIGNGEWLNGMVKIDKEPHELLSGIINDRVVSTSGAARPDGSFILRSHMLDSTHRLEVRVFIKDGKPVVDGSIFGIGGCKFHSR